MREGRLAFREWSVQQLQLELLSLLSVRRDEIPPDFRHSISWSRYNSQRAKLHATARLWSPSTTIDQWEGNSSSESGNLQTA
ncbi:hypothetical protein R1flu_020458 [Riccia fluitans]|uniref:Uncharacterized protein n=1 Tax=Riccia fluitans TaxID=41844 RepID=A0ABD1ZLY4_9MARC